MNSTIVAIPNEGGASPKEKKKLQSNLFSLFHCLTKKKGTYDPRWLIHSIKVAIALVLVSLLFILDPLYEQAGDNAMWAIMTVIVVFEFYAGATLGKGLNRGIGTILGGGMGCLAAILAQNFGRTGKAIIVSASVFIFGAAASYSRLVPSIKKRYDYAAMIFILTFNLVAVSGLRAETVIELARDRLSTIIMGFVICVSTSLFIFPVWASDELHCSTASKFDKLAGLIEGCLGEYLKGNSEKKENQANISFNGYSSVLHSKSKDETLENFARWEPWHGRFGFSYPWNKYLKIGGVLTELAASVLSLKECLQFHQQPSLVLKQPIKEPCEAVASLLACTLRELGDGIKNMKRCCPSVLITLQSTTLELSEAVHLSNRGALGNDEGFSMASFVFLLMDVVDKVERLAKEVEELADLAGFLPQ